MKSKEYEFYYNKGIVYNDEGKYTLAIENYIKALSYNRQSIEAYFNLGVAYINNKEYELAIDGFNNVLKLNPNETLAYSNIALAYSRRKNYDLAISNYQKVLALNPDDVDTYKDLADVYVRNKQYDEAINYYNKALEINPCLIQVKQSLKTAINLKNQNEPACEKEESVVYDEIQDNSNEVMAQSYFNSGVNCIKEKNIDSAIENFRNCLKISPDFPNAYNFLDKMLQIKAKMYEINK